MSVPLTPADCERWLDAMASVIGLAITPTQRDGVLANLARLAEQHALLEDFDLGANPVPAPRFEP